MSYRERLEELATTSEWDFSDLSALFINTTLKKSPEASNTRGLMDVSAEIMRRQGVTVEFIRAVDHDIARGVWPDMTEQGWEKDEWPQIFEAVKAADILVLGTPIWLGDKSSVCTHIVERLYGNSHLLNEQGQYAYYGKVGGCIVTGNEDGIKHCAIGSQGRASRGAGTFPRSPFNPCVRFSRTRLNDGLLSMVTQLLDSGRCLGGDTGRGFRTSHVSNRRLVRRGGCGHIV